MKHMFITDNANVIAGANITRQYEQTIKRYLENDLPAFFVKTVSIQKGTMDLKNGARIIWTPYDDPEKLRSMDATMWLILEGSEVKGESFRQLTTRLRNTAACTFEKDEFGNIKYIRDADGFDVPIIEYDWRKGIIESNPDSGWIRSEVLMRSQVIYQHGTNYHYEQDILNQMPNISSHVAATRVNKTLPKDFESNLRRQNPQWWCKRYLDGSFQYAEGSVYPNALSENNVIDDFPIPRHWKRIVAFDYGISDIASFVFGAVDEKLGVLFIYKVLRATNRNVQQLAQMYHIGAADIPSGGLYTQPLIDPKSGPKRGYNLRTLADEFLDFNIAFQPGVIDVDTRIYRLNTYIDSAKIKFFRQAARELLNEFRDYKFPPQDLDGKRPSDKPIDKNNHSINACEWIVCALPQDPRFLIQAVYFQGVQLQRQAITEAWQLAEETTQKQGGYVPWY